MAEPVELPVIAGDRGARADALRNRGAIICAAQRLLTESGVESITMDRVAEEAGVGKGTLFRRFGDRSGLFRALLDESERRLQEGFLRGPPPLGPGVPPHERLFAFGRALLALTAERGDLLLAAIGPGTDAVYRSPVYGAYRLHVSALLESMSVQPAGYLADVLLAGLAPALIRHQLAEHRSLEELETAWETLAGAVIGGG